MILIDTSAWIFALKKNFHEPIARIIKRAIDISYIDGQLSIDTYILLCKVCGKYLCNRLL
ncbi:hypothetical protein A45J_2098 [hot springs metagenome]|uniref:PIN domain-containing protein n=1 Tax=hot springs metagenome TaxID=433727 RepID=A0A5J4L6I6_9ZZZZ